MLNTDELKKFIAKLLFNAACCASYTDNHNDRLEAVGWLKELTKENARLRAALELALKGKI